MREKFPNRIISGPYFPAFGLISVFSPNTGKYGPEITRYLDTFRAVLLFTRLSLFQRSLQDDINRFK